MRTVDRLPLLERTRLLVLIAGAALLAAAVGWLLARARDETAEALCAQWYAAARTQADSQAVDRTLLPEIRAREVPAGGMACGVLKELGRLPSR